MSVWPLFAAKESEPLPKEKGRKQYDEIANPVYKFEAAARDMEILRRALRPAIRMERECVS